MSNSIVNDQDQQKQSRDNEGAYTETIPLPSHEQQQQRGGSDDDGGDAPDGQVRPRESRADIDGRGGKAVVHPEDDIDDDSDDETAVRQPGPTAS